MLSQGSKRREVNVGESKMFTLALINEPVGGKDGWREEDDFKPIKNRKKLEDHH